MTTTPEPGQLAEQRVCNTCGGPIAQVGPTGYVHVNGETVDASYLGALLRDGDHRATPRLAHAMDADPFGGIPTDDDLEGPHAAYCYGDPHEGACIDQPYRESDYVDVEPGYELDGGAR